MEFLYLLLLLISSGYALNSAEPGTPAQFTAKLEFSEGEARSCLEGNRVHPHVSEFHIASLHPCLHFLCSDGRLELLTNRSGCSSGSECIGHGETQIKACVKSRCNVSYSVKGQKLTARTQLITEERDCQTPTGCVALDEVYLDKGTCTNYTCTERKQDYVLVPSYQMCVDRFACRPVGYTREVTRSSCLQERCVLVRNIARFKAFYTGCPFVDRCLAFESVTSVREGNECFKIRCTQGSNGLYLLEKSPECLFEGRCYAQGETVRDGQLCASIKCVNFQGHLNWRVQEKECTVNRSTCLPVGSTMATLKARACRKVTCISTGQGQVSLHEEITGCQMEEGKCMAVGQSREAEDCQRVECVLSGTSIAYLRSYRNGCRLPDGQCIKLRETIVRKDTCVEYACAREVSFFHLTMPGLKITKLCRDFSGACYGRGETFMNGLETCTCQQQGHHVLPSCFFLSG